ncbi:MAG: branched-chain amino acid ABC transporter permease [Acetobacteraceae bacterium]|nr:branched-chain amino acid ABC transporter permease [Acetobacteraceae bacterium]
MAASGWQAACGLFALLAALPLVGFDQGHVLTLLAHIMIMAMAALSLSLLVGGAGLVSLGHAASLGFGAYALVILDGAGITEGAIVLPVAAAAAMLFALATGVIALRTSGVHFIMITLAFGQMAFFTAASLSAYGGDDGYTLYGRSTLFGARWLEARLGLHYLCLAALAGTWLLCRVLLASRFGRVLRAARQSPLRVRALGFDPLPYQLAAYVIAAGLGGIAGFLFANLTEFVAPSYLAWQRSGELLFMVILGGVGSLTGAMFGAALYVLLEEFLSPMWEHWRILFGGLLVLAVLFMPQGLSGLPRQWPRELLRR